MMKKILTIAGSDTSGGAGLAADLKTFEELETYGMSAITLIVMQDVATWSHNAHLIPFDVLEAQLETVLAGIGVDAAKTGMLPSEEVIELVAAKVRQYGVPNLVVDPVMVCKGTDEVVNPLAVTLMSKKLVPLAKVVTPNLFEAAQLSGMKPLKKIDDLKEAAQKICESGAQSVFITGGTRLSDTTAIDLFYDGKEYEILEAPLVKTTFNHGAGCTTSAAIAAYLGKGLSTKDAVIKAKEFITKAIDAGERLNDFVGIIKPWANR